MTRFLAVGHHRSRICLRAIRDAGRHSGRQRAALSDETAPRHGTTAAAVGRAATDQPVTQFVESSGKERITVGIIVIVVAVLLVRMRHRKMAAPGNSGQYAASTLPT